MSFISFDPSAGLYDATPIENMFLAEYLPSAPDSYLRVYLYLRMALLHPEMGGSIEEVCRVLRIERDTFDNAMTYWERQGLVQRATDNPPTWTFLSVLHAAPSPMESDYYRYRDFNANLQALFGAQNLLHPKEYETAHDWLNVFGFSQEAVLLAVETRLKRTRSKKPNLNAFFKKLNEEMVGYADRGLLTEEQLRRALEYDDRVYALAQKVIQDLRMHRDATEDELRLVRKWLDEWGLSEQDVLAACAQTTKTNRPSFAYLDAILKNSRDPDGGQSFEALRAAMEELGDRRIPSPEQRAACRAWLESGIEPGTIKLAAAQCARRRKHTFEDLTWMLEEWTKLGIRRVDDAEAYVARMNDARTQVHRLLTLAGKDRSVQMGDIRMYEAWRESWPADMLDFAAECARDMQLPMRYMDKLLKGWQATGVSTLEQAKAQRENRRAAQPAGQNPALNYDQRTPDETDYTSHYVNLLDLDDDEEGL